MEGQPLALRLADEMEQDYCSCHEGFKVRNLVDPQCESCQTKHWRNEASAVLRRLHAENEHLRRINQSHEMKLSIRGYEIQIEDLKARGDALLAALRRADQFITNGIELGFIRMPDEDTRDTAHETPGIVRAAIKAAEGGFK